MEQQPREPAQDTAEERSVPNSSGYNPYKEGRDPRRLNRILYTQGLGPYNEHPRLPGEKDEEP